MDKETLVKDIIGYEDLYEITSDGNVYSKPKYWGNVWHPEKRLISKKINYKTGYYEVSLCSNGKVRTFLLHRLLAIHFVDKLDGKDFVNHMNGNKLDNNLSNLEWCTISENTKHAFDNNLSGFKDRALSNINSINQKRAYKKIFLEKDKNIIEFDSVTSASLFLGVKRETILKHIIHKEPINGYIITGYR